MKIPRKILPPATGSAGLPVWQDIVQKSIGLTLPESELVRLSGLRSDDRLANRLGAEPKCLRHMLWTHGEDRRTLAQKLDATGLMLAGPRFEGPFCAPGVVAHAPTMPESPEVAPVARRNGTYVQSPAEVRAFRDGPAMDPSRPFGSFTGPGAAKAQREAGLAPTRSKKSRNRRGRPGKRERAAG